MRHVLAKAITTTGNSKLGPISTTYVSQSSCPNSCAFIDGGGCYAERGPTAIHARRLGRGTELEAALAEAQAIDEMITVVGRPLRLHTVGDCSTDEAAQIVAAAARRYMDRGGGVVWTYTHAWRTVKRKSWGDVSVLASCETPQDVKDAKRRGYVAALVVNEHKQRRRWLNNGLSILPCPSQTGDVTCNDCRLCGKEDLIRKEGYVIGFAVHGDKATRSRALKTLERRERGD